MDNRLAEIMKRRFNDKTRRETLLQLHDVTGMVSLLADSLNEKLNKLYLKMY
jgi:hypothetical protein